MFVVLNVRGEHNSVHIPLRRCHRVAAVCVQDLCREINHKIDSIDEERYDLDMKVNKSNKEVKYTKPSNLQTLLSIYLYGSRVYKDTFWGFVYEMERRSFRL